VFTQWIDYNDPSSELSAKSPDLSSSLIKFPYGQKLTKKIFNTMSLEECYAMCFPNMDKYLKEAKIESFEVADMPYRLKFKNSIMAI